MTSCIYVSLYLCINHIRIHNYDLYEYIFIYIFRYIQLSEACVESNVCVDVFVLLEDRLMSNKSTAGPMEDRVAFRDVSGMSECGDRTGGRVHLLSGSMRVEDNALRLEEEVVHTIRQIQAGAAEVITKLRISTGLKLGSFFGSGQYDPLSEELRCCGMDQDSTFCFTLRHDGRAIKDEDKVHLQLAILHTDVHSRRLVRVLNLTLTATDNPSVVFRHADLDCTIATVAKIAVDRALRMPLSVNAKVC
jgi:hypothetical protein